MERGEPAGSADGGVAHLGAQTEIAQSRSSGSGIFSGGSSVAGAPPISGPQVRDAVSQFDSGVRQLGELAACPDNEAAFPVSHLFLLYRTDP